MFRFHLVPYVFGELCLQGQNRQKEAKPDLLEAIHVARRGKAHRRAPPGGNMLPLGPTWCPATSLIRGRASTRPLQRYPMSVCFKGQDGAALDPWIHRHTLEELQPTRPSTDFLTEANDLPAMQPPLGANPRRRMERRWILALADA